MTHTKARAAAAGKAALEAGRDGRSIVIVWDNFGSTLVDRAKAVAASDPHRPVVGADLHRKCTAYGRHSEPGAR